MLLDVKKFACAICVGHHSLNCVFLHVLYKNVLITCHGSLHEICLDTLIESIKYMFYADYKFDNFGWNKSCILQNSNGTQ